MESKINTDQDIAVVRRADGALLWRSVESGPRGGRRVLWAPRRPGEARPSAWVVWSPRAQDVDYFDVVMRVDRG